MVFSFLKDAFLSARSAVRILRHFSPQRTPTSIKKKDDKDQYRDNIKVYSFNFFDFLFISLRSQRSLR
jgi:hypothetical protein